MCAPWGLTILAAVLALTGSARSMAVPEDNTSSLPCQEKELEHFRREYENCNKKAFSEIEINFDGKVRSPVNGNATCRAFDMLISECTKMLTFCFPDSQVEETVEKQKQILKATVELLLPTFDWEHCWTSFDPAPSTTAATSVLHRLADVHSQPSTPDAEAPSTSTTPSGIDATPTTTLTPEPSPTTSSDQTTTTTTVTASTTATTTTTAPTSTTAKLRVIEIVIDESSPEPEPENAVPEPVPSTSGAEELGAVSSSSGIFTVPTNIACFIVLAMKLIV